MTNPLYGKTTRGPWHILYKNLMGVVSTQQISGKPRDFCPSGKHLLSLCVHHVLVPERRNAAEKIDMCYDNAML